MVLLWRPYGALIRKSLCFLCDAMKLLAIVLRLPQHSTIFKILYERCDCAQLSGYHTDTTVLDIVTLSQF